MVELYAIYALDGTLYAHAYDAAGKVWNGSAFVDWSDGSRSSYKIALTREGTSFRRSASGPDGTTAWIAYLQAGEADAASDLPVYDASVATAPDVIVAISPGTTTVAASGSEQVFGAKRVDRKFTQGESGTFTVSCLNADGEPIDLTGQTLKLILHEEGDDEPIVALSTPTITIGTGDNKHVATIPVATLTTVKRRCMYVFRSTTLGNTVRMYGVWDVRAAPVG